jgi:hypothetical protein
MNFFLLPLLAILLPLVYAAPPASGHLMSAVNLRAACPNEEVRCHNMASKGLCQGVTSDPLLEMVWQTCKCSCMVAANYRVKQCCTAVAMDSKCMNLCRRNLTVDDYLNPDNSDCAEGLPSLIYCAGEGVDARPCCAKAGVSPQCQTLCNSQEASAGCGGPIELMSTYAPCLDEIPKVRKCMMKHISFTPSFDKNWRPKCPVTDSNNSNE